MTIPTECEVSGVYEISYWVEAQAWMRPDKVALVGSRERWTYRDLHDRVVRLSRAFRNRLGLEPGDRIAIYSGNCLEYLLVLLAASRAGLVLVPLNWRLTPGELEYQLRDSGTRRILCSAEYAAAAAELTGRIGLEPPVRITPAAEPDSLPDLAGLLDAEPSGLEPPGERDPQPWDRPLLICYTSGTTGRPKGAVLNSVNMFFNAINNLLTIDLRADDVCITLLPLFHIGGINLFTLPALFAGGRVVVPDRFDPDQAVRLIQEEKVTVVFGVPTVHQRLLEAIDRLKPDLSHVRMFYSGGAPCPVPLIRAFQERGYRFGQGYGLTETAPTVFMLLEDDFARKPGSIGRPAPFNRVRVIDPATGQPVPPGGVGEITVRGPNVFTAYWQNEKATAEAIRNGWFHTGDLARIDEEGFVTIAGRLKEMIISGGENIYPVEVEQAIQTHPAVVEAAVFGVPHPEWGEVPHAAVLLEPGASVTEEELRAHCLARLGKYKIPRRFFILDELPRNAAGKVVKSRLAEITRDM